MRDHNSSLNCIDHSVGFQASMYAATYIIIFIPGLLGNSVALWVLWHFIMKKKRAVIFMINLAAADLAHVLSLPLRMHYYLNHTWPFGNFLCQFSFYLKYLNMYAGICFLTCISIQRYLFLLHPFKAQNWKCRYDVVISTVVWTVVGAACLPLPVLRSPSLTNSTNTCFADLGVRQLNQGASIALVAVAELSGFLVPLAIILCCTWKIRQSLQASDTPLQQANEKQKAWHMILGCAAVFFVCFTPYHVNFPVFMMVKQDVIADCSIRHHILCFHAVSLCLASLNCCLDPILYYFMTSEFQERLFQSTGGNIWRSFINRILTRGRIRATRVDEEEDRNTTVLRTYFWTLQRHRSESDSMELTLSA